MKSCRVLDGVAVKKDVAKLFIHTLSLGFLQGVWGRISVVQPFFGLCTFRVEGLGVLLMLRTFGGWSYTVT